MNGKLPRHSLSRPLREMPELIILNIKKTNKNIISVIWDKLPRHSCRWIKFAPISEGFSPQMVANFGLKPGLVVGVLVGVCYTGINAGSNHLFSGNQHILNYIEKN